LLKTKITTRFAAVTFDVNGRTNLSRRFAEGLDALGAQRLLDHPTLFHDRNLLEVGFERAVGGTLGERAIMTECGCLAAGVALSHLMRSFPYNDCDARPALVEGRQPLYKGRAFYHTTQPTSR